MEQISSVEFIRSIIALNWCLYFLFNIDTKYNNQNKCALSLLCKKRAFTHNKRFRHSSFICHYICFAQNARIWLMVYVMHGKEINVDDKLLCSFDDIELLFGLYTDGCTCISNHTIHFGGTNLNLLIFKHKGCMFIKHR